MRQQCQTSLESSYSIDDEKNDAEAKNENGVLLQHSTSDLGALLHVLKGSLGAGILAMPYAFKNGGLLFGLIGAIVIGFIVTHATAILIRCSQSLCEIYNKNCMSFADTAEYAFVHGYKGRFKRHASKARLTVNFFLFITYYGGSAYYVLLVASTTKQVADWYFDVDISVRFFTTGLIFLLYPIGIVRLIKYLVPFSAVANILLIVALTLIFIETLTDLPPIETMPRIAEASQLPIFIAMVFAGMEGIGTIMAVENEMRNPKHLIHGPRILYMGMAVVGTLTASVGFFGYWKYGENVQGAISLNLSDDWVSHLVQVIIALVILFSFGLQMTVSTKVLWDSVPEESKDQQWLYYLLRSGLIFGSVLMATALPSLGGVVGLFGSIGFSTLGILVPAAIELVFFGGQNTNPIDWRLFKNISLILFSIVCAVTGAYCSILDMLKE